TLGGIQPRLQVGSGPRLWPLRRSPPRGGGAKVTPPGIQPVGSEPQLMADDCRRLAAAQPVLDRCTLKGGIILTAHLHRYFIHRFGRFTVPRFHRPSIRGSPRCWSDDPEIRPEMKQEPTE